MSGVFQLLFSIQPSIEYRNHGFISPLSKTLHGWENAFLIMDHYTVVMLRETEGWKLGDLSLAREIRDEGSGCSYTARETLNANTNDFSPRGGENAPERL